MTPTNSPHNKQPHAQRGPTEGDMPNDLLTVSPELACEQAVEMVQVLARELMKGEGEPSVLVENTYEQVTQLLARALNTSRSTDVVFLSGLIKELFGLSAEHEDSYATDLLCSDIAGVKFDNRQLGSTIDFVHNLLTSIRRIGLFANSSVGESSDWDSAANEKFLITSADELVTLLSNSALEFFHKR